MVPCELTGLNGSQEQRCQVPGIGQVPGFSGPQFPHLWEGGGPTLASSLGIDRGVLCQGEARTPHPQDDPTQPSTAPQGGSWPPGLLSLEPLYSMLLAPG